MVFVSHRRYNAPASPSICAPTKAGYSKNIWLNRRRAVRVRLPHRKPTVGTPDVAVMLAGSPAASKSRNSASVRPFESSDCARWDEFITRHPQGSFFQLTGWKRVIEKTFGYKPCRSEEHTSEL